MRKFINCGFLILMLCAFAAAQETKKDDTKIKKLPGKIKGEIIIKNATGNNLGGFKCFNLRAIASRMHRHPVTGQKWTRESLATGNFSARRCAFLITDVPVASGAFSISVQMESAPCEQKSIKADSSFPLELKKGGETLTYNITIYELRCVVIK
ncbi:MAG TPA: hypothetical protein VF599_08990 [Pyrinomonadaceae bacterium]|jgi:hypothetical protein